MGQRAGQLANERAGREGKGKEKEKESVRKRAEETEEMAENEPLFSLSPVPQSA